MDFFSHRSQCWQRMMEMKVDIVVNGEEEDEVYRRFDDEFWYWKVKV